MTGVFHKFPVEGRPKLRRKRRAGGKRTPGASSTITTGTNGDEGAGAGGSVASGSQDTITYAPSPRAGNPTSPSSTVGPVRTERQTRGHRARMSDPMQHYVWMTNTDQLSPPAAGAFPVTPSSTSRSSMSSVSPSPGPSASSRSPQSIGSRRNAVSVSPINPSHSFSGTVEDYPSSAPLMQSSSWPLLPPPAYVAQNPIGHGGPGPSIGLTVTPPATAGAAVSDQLMNTGYHEAFSPTFSQRNDYYEPIQRSDITSYNTFNHSTSHSFTLPPDAPYDPPYVAEQSPGLSPAANIWQITDLTFSTPHTANPAFGYGSHDGLNAHISMPSSLAMQTFPNQAYSSSAPQFNIAGLEPLSDFHLGDVHSMPPTPEVPIPDPNPHYVYDVGSSSGGHDRRGSLQSQQCYPCASSAFGFPPNE